MKLPLDDKKTTGFLQLKHMSDEMKNVKQQGSTARRESSKE